MNKAILMGRLTRDPELRQTATGISVCSFTLAVDRRFRNANGDRQADFIPIVAWRQQADFAAKYFKQGLKVVVIGQIQVRSWEDREGNRRYSTEVIADELEFAESKRSSDSYQNQSGDSYGRKTDTYAETAAKAPAENAWGKAAPSPSFQADEGHFFSEEVVDVFFPPPGD